jgi:hypothetical protein
MDGSTLVALGPPFAVDDRAAFEGWFDTPNHKVAVWTMEWEKFVEISVPTTRAEVRIWANDPSEPDDLYIGVGPVLDRSFIQDPPGSSHSCISVRIAGATQRSSMPRSIGSGARTDVIRAAARTRGQSQEISSSIVSRMTS